MRKPFNEWFDEFLLTFDKHPRLTRYFAIMCTLNVIAYFLAGVYSLVLRTFGGYGW